MMHYSKNLITTLIISVVLITVTNATNPEIEAQRKECKERMTSIFGDTNASLSDVYKYSIKHVLGCQFSSGDDELAEEYFYIPANNGYVLYDKVRLPEKYCKEAFGGDDDCIKQLEAVFINKYGETTERSIHGKAYIFCKQAPDGSGINKVYAPIRGTQYYVYPSNTFVYHYLGDIADLISLQTDIPLEHQTPSNFCDHRIS